MEILQINIKSRKVGEPGIPKHPVNEVVVSQSGVSGDFNVYRFNSKKNTPDRAVLIMTEDILNQLNKEGWKVKSGDLGENFLIDGVSYSELEAGMKVKLGGIQIELTEQAQPCRTLRHLRYIGDENINGFINTLKGRRGWYAKVIQEGTVNVHDPIALMV